MLTKKQNIELGRFALDIESHNEQFKYMLLNRLQTDCKYYLGYGNGNECARNQGRTRNQEFGGSMHRLQPLRPDTVVPIHAGGSEAGKDSMAASRTGSRNSASDFCGVPVFSDAPYPFGR